MVAPQPHSGLEALPGTGGRETTGGFPPWRNDSYLPDKHCGKLSRLNKFQRCGDFPL